MKDKEQKCIRAMRGVSSYNTSMNSAAIHQWLGGFALDEWIAAHVAVVVGNLPEMVRSDIMDDPGFVVCDYEPGAMMLVPVRFSGGGRAGRSIVLKRTIKRRPVPFVRWLIAHELAHAYLRHEGRFENEDPEFAADALAAEWGFPKPDVAMWR